MTRWHWPGRIEVVNVLSALTVVTAFFIATVATACPSQCQCTQPYYVYCQRAGLTFDTLRPLLTSVPSQAMLLDLTDNAVEKLPSGTLDSLVNLEYLVLARNRIAFLGPSVFRCLQQLKQLDLIGNDMNVVNTGLFTDLPNLKKLYLNHNDIQEIEVRAFSLVSLHELHLQNNKLTVLKASQLLGLSELRYLDLSHNNIHSLEMGCLRELGSLQVLRLTGNQLSSVAENAFQGLMTLQELWLDGNLLPSLDCFDAPNFASTLLYLRLNNNSLLAVPSNVFSRMLNLRMLLLDHNQISHVGQQAFDGLQLDKLTLAHNYIEAVDRDMLDGTRRISELDLSHNRISTIKTGAFDSFRESLYVLDLSSNRLAALDQGMFRGMKNLQRLDLSLNALSSLAGGTFQALTQLAHLQLDLNSLEWLTADLLQGPAALQRLSLVGNPVRELRGFTFDDAAFGHPVSIVVNLTLLSSSPDSLTVSWPYRQGSQLYWTFKVWCISYPKPFQTALLSTSSTSSSFLSLSSSSVCDSRSPVIERSIPPNRVSEMVSGLHMASEYFVCVLPVFLTRNVEVSQCLRVSTASYPSTTTLPESQGSQDSNSGTAMQYQPGALLICVLFASAVGVANLPLVLVRVIMVLSVYMSLKTKVVSRGSCVKR